MVRFASWRAAGRGNWTSRNLVRKSTERWASNLAGRNESKARAGLERTSWTPTRRFSGEGRADPEPTQGKAYTDNHETDRATGVVSTACQEGSLQSVGEARGGRSVACCNEAGKGFGPPGRRRGPEVLMKLGNARGGKGPYLWERLRRRKG